MRGATASGDNEHALVGFDDSVIGRIQLELSGLDLVEEEEIGMGQDRAHRVHVEGCRGIDHTEAERLAEFGDLGLERGFVLQKEEVARHGTAKRGADAADVLRGVGAGEDDDGVLAIGGDGDVGVTRGRIRAYQVFGVDATPAFFINGRFLSGAQPQASFETLIDEELKKARQSGIGP